MKTTSNCLLLFVLYIVCISCSGDTYLHVGNEDGKGELIFNNGKSSSSLTINCNKDWTISSSAQWCTHSLGSGKKTEIITISVEENTTGAERECTLTVRAEDETQTVRVVQQN